MDDLLSEFLTETVESLAVIDVELVKFNKNPTMPKFFVYLPPRTPSRALRGAGLPRLESAAHAGENVRASSEMASLTSHPKRNPDLRRIDTI